MGAVISECGKFRYRLDRQIGDAGPVYAFFGVNPSTADASLDAITALIERQFGHATTIQPVINIGAAYHACTISLVEYDDPLAAENCRTPALAMCAAFLTALIAQAQS